MDPQRLLEVIYSSFHASQKPFGQCNNDWGHMGFSGSQESPDVSDLARNRPQNRCKMDEKLPFLMPRNRRQSAAATPWARPQA